LHIYVHAAQGHHAGGPFTIDFLNVAKRQHGFRAALAFVR
jgi:hypothetical protein